VPASTAKTGSKGIEVTLKAKWDATSSLLEAFEFLVGTYYSLMCIDHRSRFFIIKIRQEWETFVICSHCCSSSSLVHPMLARKDYARCARMLFVVGRGGSQQAARIN
jgi:hypothetical protein